MKAVVFVDVQNDFIDGALKNEQAIAVLPKIVEFAKQCEDDDECNIYLTRDTHKKTVYADIHRLNGELDKNVPWNGYLASLEGKRLPVEHCIEGTDGWMINSKLLDALHIGYANDDQPMFACTFVNKTTFGSYDLAEIIHEDDVNMVNRYNHFNHCDKKTMLDEIVLCGFCTGICVLANAVFLRAKFPDTKITVMKDLCACVTPESHNCALEAMEMQQIDVA